MPRNPFWTSADAALLTSLLTWQIPDGSITFSPANPPSQFWDNEGFFHGAITTFEVIDFVTVFLEVGNTYDFLATGSFQTELSIFDNQGYLLIYDDPDDPGIPGSDAYPLDSIVEFTPDYTGVHYLWFGWEFVDTTGLYSIGAFEDEPAGGGGGGGDNAGNTFATANQISVPFNTNGSVGAGADIADYFKFTAPNSGVLTARLTGLSGDIDLVLYDSSAALLNFSENGGSASESLTYLLVGGQTYYIGVEPFLSASSNYSLTLGFDNSVGNGPISSTAPVSSISSSGDPETNALIGGTKWGGGAGSPVTVTYSFPTSNSFYSAAVYEAGSEPFNNFAPLNEGQKAAVRSALGLWADLANITFVEVTESAATVGDLRFAFSSGVDFDSAAHAYLPNPTSYGGDIWFSHDGANSSWLPGSFEFLTVVHEIGHALGLKHPFDSSKGSGVVLPGSLDQTAFTVMAYNGASIPPEALFGPTTPMGIDVDAIQYLYGVNTATRSGNTVYEFQAGQNYYQTIWDGGGIDTIVYVSQADGAVISLAPESWSQLGNPVAFSSGPSRDDNLYIASAAVIENATGGHGPDWILGNSASNNLVGNGSDDTLDGGDSDDTVNGGAGNDSLIGGPGVDVAIFSGLQSVYQVRPLPGEQHYRVSGPDGIDELLGVEVVQFGANAPVQIESAITPDIPTVSIGSALIQEGNAGSSNLLFTVSLSAAGQQAVTATVSTSALSATVGADFVSSTGMVTIPAGQTSTTFSVPIIGDALIEPAETFTVTLSNPTNATLGIQSSATGTIQDNDTGTVSITGTSVPEGNSGSSSASLTVTLSAQSATPTIINFATVNGTAQAGSDFTAISNGSVTISAGSTTAAILVSILDDTMIEPNETFSVTLSGTNNPSISVALGGGTAQATILNDDALPVLSVGDATVTEGGLLSFSVSLSGVIQSQVTVQFSTTNGSATAGADFGSSSGTLVFSPGGAVSQSVVVSAFDDASFEGTENFTVDLSLPNGATIGDGQGLGTIFDNDLAPPALSIANASITEGNGGSVNLLFPLTLSSPSNQAISVNVTALTGAAGLGSDFGAPAALATIPAGQTSVNVSVPVFGDGAFEIDEVFLVVLSNPSGGATINPGAAFARGTIVNDDQPAFPSINGQVVNGTGGDDFLVGGAFSDSINGQGGGDTEFGNEASDILLGGPGNDFIVADFPNNFAFGSADYVDAGEGNDFAFGGGGDDTMIGGLGDDLLGGDMGNNLILGGEGNNALYGFDGSDTIQGGNGGDIVFGLTGSDVIVTLGGFDLLIDDPAIGGGADFIDAGDGGSQIFAGSDNDTVFAGVGDDFILGESGADWIVSGAGIDVLIAGPGNDTLDAGSGNDIIIAEGGDDLIAGGAGQDKFRYPSGIAVNADRILDFVPADDTVELGASFGLSAAQALAALTQAGGDAVLNLGGGNAITFVGVSAAAFTAADFVVV